MTAMLLNAHPAPSFVTKYREMKEKLSSAKSIVHLYGKTKPDRPKTNNPKWSYLGNILAYYTTSIMLVIRG